VVGAVTGITLVEMLSENSKFLGGAALVASLAILEVKASEKKVEEIT
jgi:hypothetical protein